MANDVNFFLKQQPQFKKGGRGSKIVRKTKRTIHIASTDNFRAKEPYRTIVNIGGKPTAQANK